MADLRTTLKKKLLEHDLSASALERKAGIRPSSLQNIIQGRSKNPSIDILKRTAQSLHCTVSELLGEDESSPDITSLCATGVNWHQDLYIHVAEKVLSIYTQKKISTSKRVLLHAIEKVYAYGIQYEKKTVDKDFVDWVITQLIQSEKEGEL